MKRQRSGTDTIGFDILPKAIMSQTVWVRNCFLCIVQHTIVGWRGEGGEKTTQDHNDTLVNKDPQNSIPHV